MISSLVMAGSAGGSSFLSSLLGDCRPDSLTSAFRPSSLCLWATVPVAQTVLTMASAASLVQLSIDKPDGRTARLREQSPSGHGSARLGVGSALAGLSSGVFATGLVTYASVPWCAFRVRLPGDIPPPRRVSGVSA
jgi:hypothetical protein